MNDCSDAEISNRPIIIKDNRVVVYDYYLCYNCQMQDWKDYLLHVGLSCIGLLFNCQILVAKINVMLCYRDIVICTAYVNLNLDVNTIFSALDRTNR